MQRDYKIEGIVARVRDSGETDRDYHIISSSHGLVTARAFGARKSVKRSLPDMLTAGEFALYYNRFTDYRQLKEVVVYDHFTSLKSDVDSYFIALFFSELLLKSHLLGGENQHCYRLFVQAVTLLDHQAGGDDKNKIVMELLFLQRFLYLSGITAALKKCPLCNREIAPDSDSYYLRRGAFACVDCGSGRGQLPAALRRHLLSESDRQLLESAENFVMSRFSCRQLAGAVAIGRRLARVVIDQELNSVATLPRRPFLNRD